MLWLGFCSGSCCRSVPARLPRSIEIEPVLPVVAGALAVGGVDGVGAARSRAGVVIDGAVIGGTVIVGAVMAGVSGRARRRPDRADRERRDRADEPEREHGADDDGDGRTRVGGSRSATFRSRMPLRVGDAQRRAVRSRSCSSIAFHAGVGPAGPCGEAVHWPSAFPRSISARSASAELRHLVVGDADDHALVAGAHDRDRRVPAERAPGDRRRSARPVRRLGSGPADAALAHDARREPHQADDDAERDDQAREQRERRRGRHQAAPIDSAATISAMRMPNSSSITTTSPRRDQRAVDEHVDRGCRRRGRAR